MIEGTTGLQGPPGLDMTDVSWRAMTHTQLAYSLWVRDVYVGFIAQRSSAETWHGSLVLPKLPEVVQAFEAGDEDAAKFELLARTAGWFAHFRGLNLDWAIGIEIAKPPVLAEAEA